MLSRKVSGRLRNKKTYRACLIRQILLVLVFLAAGYGNAIALSKDKVDVDAVCDLIYHGQFETAGNLLKQFDPNGHSIREQLAGVVSEYEVIEQKRRQAKEAAYKEKLEELVQLQLAADTNEVNDINDISKVLGVVIRTNEFANDKQKEEILARKFVKETIQKAVDKASEYESKGEWVEAYAVYYSLKLIYEENEAYADYAEQLITKANIVASFQDSPCQTSKDRYAGVKKEMFIRTIDALKFSYVHIIDFHQMATKAIERCQLLSEVMRLSFPQIQESINTSSADEKPEFSFTPPDSRQLSAWSLGLKAILNEVDRSFPGMTKDRFVNVFEKVLVLNANTVQLPRTVLIANFAEAALYSLDPYTIIVWPQHVSEFDKTMSNTFTGIGIRLQKEKGKLKVASLLPDTPAYKSGMDAGDFIEKVNGLETKDMTITCAVKKITGPQGTKVTLTMRRPAYEEKTEDKVWDIVITRAKIIVPPVRGWQRTEKGRSLYMLDEENKIGYVYISSFDSRTSGDFEKVLVKLENASMKGVIVDLRGNPGGLLPSAIEIVDKFIEKGLMLTTQPRFGVWTWEYAKRKTHPDYPVVILINSASASASEIVSGALADDTYERAVLVGDRTHGKGSVQSITSYPGGGAQLKYTMAYYHLPSGQRVESKDMMKKRGKEDWGVAPDVKIKLRSDELKKKYDAHWDNLVLARADHNNGSKPLKKHTAKELIDSDQQLAVGLLVLKTKLIQQESSLLASKN